MTTEFERYFTERRRALLRFATVLVGDPARADEIVADVLGRVFEKWSRVAAADDVHAYVRRMIVNEFVSWRRRAGRVAVWSDLEPFARTVIVCANPADSTTWFDAEAALP